MSYLVTQIYTHQSMVWIKELRVITRNEFSDDLWSSTKLTSDIWSYPLFIHNILNYLSGLVFVLWGRVSGTKKYSCQTQLELISELGFWQSLQALLRPSLQIGQKIYFWLPPFSKEVGICGSQVFDLWELIKEGFGGYKLRRKKQSSGIWFQKVNFTSCRYFSSPPSRSLPPTKESNGYLGPISFFWSWTCCGGRQKPCQ